MSVYENKNFWKDVFKLLEIARSTGDDDLLEACLDGRPPERDSVLALRSIAMSGLDWKNTIQLPGNSNPGRRIVAACCKFLGEDMPLSSKDKVGGILAEMGYDEPEEEIL
jgi:hypothetical protein